MQANNKTLRNSIPLGRELIKLIKCTELTLAKTALLKKQMVKLFYPQSLPVVFQKSRCQEWVTKYFKKFLTLKPDLIYCFIDYGSSIENILLLTPVCFYSYLENCLPARCFDIILQLFCAAL